MEKTGKILRTLGLVAVGLLLLTLIIFNVNTTPPASDKVWDMRTTVGDANAKNLFIMYTDLACPYCDVFSRAIMENQEEFEQYIADNSILFEVRLMNFLYNYGESHPDMSNWSAQATVCATEEGRFWDYYHASIKALWDDYQSKGIGASKTSPAITGMTRDYWVKIGGKIGMDEKKLSDCMSSTETAKTLDARVEKMTRSGASGLPYFVEGNFTQNGFDTSWGWEEVKEYLAAGLKK